MGLVVWDWLRCHMVFGNSQLRSLGVTPSICVEFPPICVEFLTVCVEFPVICVESPVTSRGNRHELPRFFPVTDDTSDPGTGKPSLSS